MKLKVGFRLEGMSGSFTEVVEVEEQDDELILEALQSLVNRSGMTIYKDKAPIAPAVKDILWIVPETVSTNI